MKKSKWLKKIKIKKPNAEPTGQIPMEEIQRPGYGMHPKPLQEDQAFNPTLPGSVNSDIRQNTFGQ